MNPISDRILTKLGDKELIDKLSTLSRSDFNSLLLNIFKSQAQNTAPIDILKAFQANRFSVPSKLDPVAYHLFEAEFLSLAQKADLKAVLLSPAAPFSSSSAFGCVDQNNVVSATRGVEILSDPTNMLAIIIADQLKNKEADNLTPIHYCTTARTLRAQAFPNKKGYYSHFGIFCIVSSGKDNGSYACEKELLSKQLNFYRKALFEKYGANLSIILRKRPGYTDTDGFFDRMVKFMEDEFPDIPIQLNLENEENHYYTGINYTIIMEKDNQIIEIGDGGFVDWTQQMTNNRKERCLISGIGLDRLLI